MLGIYLRAVEEEISDLIKAIDGQDQPLLYWEHWFNEQTSNRPLYSKINFYYYYITLGVFLGTPIASIIIGWNLTDFNLSLETSVVVELVIGILAVIILIVFTIIYCHHILQTK